MKNEVKRRIEQAVKLAGDIGADEIVEALSPLLEIRFNDVCLRSLKENGMEGYCGTACAACGYGTNHEGHEGSEDINFYGGTGMQPRGRG